MPSEEVFLGTRYISHSIIKDKAVLRDSYIPESLPGRDNQIFQLTKVLSDLLADERPNDVAFIGKPGTGKTAVAKHVINKYKKEYSSLRVRFVYVNCSQASTAYRVLYQLNRSFGVLVPPSGYPYDVLWGKFVDAFTSSSQRLVLVLDEVDLMVKRDGGRLLYSLTRLNYELPEGLSISLLVISNNLNFLDRLDPRERSSFAPITVYFPPYNADQLYLILRQRADLGLKLGTWEDDALRHIAAVVARESGDARRAIDALRMAAELAEGEGAERLTVDHAARALSTVNEEEVTIAIRTLPLHHRLVLAAVLDVMESARVNGIRAGTGAIYRSYQERVMRDYGLRPLTMRRVSGILRELEAIGLIEIEMHYGGARGNTKVVKSTALPTQKLRALLSEMGIM